MSAPVLTAKPAQTCPAWCQHEAEQDGVDLHMSEVGEVGDVLINLHQYFSDEERAIGVSDSTDQELFFSLHEAERLGRILLDLARTGRRTARRAA